LVELPFIKRRALRSLYQTCDLSLITLLRIKKQVINPRQGMAFTLLPRS
jgi:hypothetical protein